MRHRLRRLMRLLLHVEGTPHSTALAFGIGVWIAWSPLIGVHTALALGLAFLFRLNRLAILIGTYINNPWTVAPLYMAGTALGCVMLGISPRNLVSPDWSLVGRGFSGAALDGLRIYLWPFVVGNTVLGTAGGLAGYAILKRVLEARGSRAGLQDVTES